MSAPNSIGMIFLKNTFERGRGYGADSHDETQHFAAGIAGNAELASCCETFRGGMICGKGPESETAIGSLKVLAEKLKKAQT